MALALILGRRGFGRTWPNPAVGAIIVKDDIIVGRGWTQSGGRPHAETEALRRAGDAARGATMYVTLEPCSHHGQTPPCANAIVAAGITRVVSAMDDPNPAVSGAGHRILRSAGIKVDVGTGAEAAWRTHAGHVRRMRDGRPHVLLKLAVSADAKAGLAGRRPAAITGSAARNRVHLMRAMSDAVLTGIGTVLSDDPLLTCRLPGMADRSPVRVVLDRGLRLPHDSRLVATARQTPLWVLTGDKTPAPARQALNAFGVDVFSVAAADGKIDLVAGLKVLAGRGVTRVMVEAGPILSAAFVKNDLVDELALFRSSKMIGPDGLDALEGSSIEALTRSAKFERIDAGMAGEDVFETFERAKLDHA